MKLIEYKEDRIFGIPKIMFPYLNLYLLQALIYFIIKKEKDEIEERELVRFIMFWMVNNPDKKKSSESSKEIMKFIDEGKNLVDIYDELTKVREENRNLFFKLISFKYEKLEFCNLMTLEERALKYFGEKNKELYKSFSKDNNNLLLWIQREFISNDEVISNYEPLAIHNEDNVPYDFDHLVPQSNWSSLSTNGTSLNNITDKTNKENFGKSWVRRDLGNLIGNYRVLDSSTNRKRGDESLEVGFKNKFEDDDNFILFEEDLTNWKIASPKENKFEWDDNRVQKFQYVIEKRVLDLYHKIIDDLEFEQWNKYANI